MSLLFEDIEYKYLNSESEYISYLNELKQSVLLMIHINYAIKEIENYLKSKAIEKDVMTIILSYAEKVIAGGRKEHIDGKDKNHLISLWYQQYLDFGKKEINVHQPDLIIFKFQKDEIDKLIEKYSVYLNSETKSVLYEILDRLYNNEFFSVRAYKNAFKKGFGIRGNSIPKNHKFGDFLDKSIKLKGYTDKMRLWKLFEIAIESFILGGEFDSKQGKFIPFFMNDNSLNKKLKKYLNDKLQEVIEIYFNKLTEARTEVFLKQNDLLFPELKNVRRLLSVPVIEFHLFEGIKWNFMPENEFWDGQAGKEQKNKMAYYTMNLHPLSLYYCFFNRKEFEIFIIQLLHHEFVHIMQYRYADIYDKYLNNPKWYSKEENKRAFEVLEQFAIQRWIREKIPANSRNKLLWNYLHMSGGHTPTFMKEMQRFKGCKKAMQRRGSIETLYASFYYKRYGKDMFSGKWYLCNPEKK